MVCTVINVCVCVSAYHRPVPALLLICWDLVALRHPRARARVCVCVCVCVCGRVGVCGRTHTPKQLHGGYMLRRVLHTQGSVRHARSSACNLWWALEVQRHPFGPMTLWCFCIGSSSLACNTALCTILCPLGRMFRIARVHHSAPRVYLPRVQQCRCAVNGRGCFSFGGALPMSP